MRGSDYGLGMALRHQKNTAAAIEAFNEAVRLDPGEAGASNNPGTALADKGNTPAAIDAYRKALAIDPTVNEKGK